MSVFFLGSAIVKIGSLRGATRNLTAEMVNVYMKSLYRMEKHAQKKTILELMTNVCSNIWYIMQCSNKDELPNELPHQDNMLVLLIVRLLELEIQDDALNAIFAACNELRSSMLPDYTNCRNIRTKIEVLFPLCDAEYKRVF